MRWDMGSLKLDGDDGSMMMGGGVFLFDCFF